MSGVSEHLIAYLGTALVLGLSARDFGHLIRIGLLLTVYSGVLEAVQLYLPGRHARLSDVVTSATGIMIGCLIAAAFILSMHRRR
jgi:VanZ family protein